MRPRDTSEALDKKEELPAVWPVLGRNMWMRELPRVPLTKLELKEHIKECMKTDEVLRPDELAAIGSGSASANRSLMIERSFDK